jgi:hypothetical protein
MESRRDIGFRGTLRNVYCAFDGITMRLKVKCGMEGYDNFVLSVLLRYTDSDYPFGIFKHFSLEIRRVISVNTIKPHMSRPNEIILDT